MWRYFYGCKVKHYLIDSKVQFAVCGRGPLWYDPKGWLSDITQLQQLPKCKSCLKFSEGLR